VKLGFNKSLANILLFFKLKGVVWPMSMPITAVNLANTMDLDPEAYPYTPPYAGFWRRYAATIIDGLIVQLITLIPSFIIGVVLGGMAHGNAELESSINAVSSAIGLLIGIAFLLLYYGYFESQHQGQTLGRKALGIALQTTTGQPITWGKSVVRHFCRMLSGALLCVGFLMQVFSQHRQALHDSMTDCVVVRTKTQATWVPWVVNAGVFVFFALAWLVMVIVVVGIRNSALTS
jgi:uncharacterized RDD family membrane protein YckC